MGFPIGAMGCNGTTESGQAPEPMGFRAQTTTGSGAVQVVSACQLKEHDELLWE